MECLVRTGNDLALIRLVTYRIAIETNLKIRIDRKGICLDPCALSKYHCCLSASECCQLILKCGLKRLVIAVLNCKINKVKEIIVKCRIIRNLCLTLFKRCYEIGYLNTCITSSCCQEMLPYMFEYPPLTESCCKRLVACLRNLLACCFQLFCRLWELCDAALFKDCLIVYDSKIVALDCKAVNTTAVFRRFHCGCNGRKHRLGQRLSGQIIRPLFVYIDLFS